MGRYSNHVDQLEKLCACRHPSSQERDESSEARQNCTTVIQASVELQPSDKKHRLTAQTSAAHPEATEARVP